MNKVIISAPISREDVVLWENQYIELVLHKRCRVEINGFLVIKDVSADGFTYRICINPHVIGWQRPFKLYLGTIVVDNIIAPIFLRSSALGGRLGVHLVNPIWEYVQIGASEMIEVLIHNGPDIIHPVIEDSGDLRLEHLRTESYCPHGFDGPRWIGLIAKKLNLTKYRHHFWFRLNPESVHRIEDKVHYLGKIKFLKGKNYLNNEVNVQLISNRWQNEHAVGEVVTTVLTGCDKLKRDAAYTGLTRFVDLEQGIICNPNSIERIEFASDQKSMIVELVNPSHSYGSTDEQWIATVKDTWNNKSLLSLKQLSPIIVNTHTIQRWHVENLHTLNYGEYSTTLGTILFVCGTRAFKKLDFVVVDKTIGVRRQDFNFDLDINNNPDADYDYDMIPPMGGFSTHHAKIGRYTTKVTIEELPAETLEQGANVVSMKSFSPNVTRYNGLVTIVNPTQDFKVNILADEKLDIIFSDGKKWKTTYVPHSIVVGRRGYLGEAQVFSYSLNHWVKGGSYCGEIRFATNGEIRRVFVKVVYPISIR